MQGDLDGDGFSDLVVPGDQEVLVFFGGRGGVSDRPVSMRHPFVFGGQQTRFADAIEDLDGDGVDDAPRELVHPPMAVNAHIDGAQGISVARDGRKRR